MAKNDNLRIWDALGKTDPKHTKQFTRAGGFKGTAIKPMWANKQMTEFFGACGIEWGTGKPEFVQVPVDGEILVFCTVEMWYVERRPEARAGEQIRRGSVFGVGGDKVVARGKEGFRSDDEAFKKAYTDALSNAMKFIGVGADVHMGQFEDNKYVREVAAEFDEAKKAEVHAEVERQKSNVGPSPELARALKAEEMAQDEKYHVPPELDWSYQKSSGVLICRVVNAEKVWSAKGKKDYVLLTVNNELDKGKKPLLYYWHATHRDALLAAKGKVVKLLVIAKEKGFTVDQVMEIGGVKVGLETPELDNPDSNLGDIKQFRQNMVRNMAFAEVETQARLLASVLGFEDEHLRELHAMNKHSWPDVLEALKVRKAEVEAGVEAGSR